ncbi:hypothetical protein ZHAS_00014551 [Anopheles sinensis]|uniref:CBM20 domain-containing protein n=1 Tax=Anopheles sinensis TaxID=74873 RepID=A0A084W8V1_ANOSI|nr:hypothetical protein ZHAS_00014551 [Anopheles sinensis]
MQRWWFLEENGEAKDSPSSSSSHAQQQDPTGKRQKQPKQAGDRRHTFRVLVTYDLLKDETVAISGSCETLGSWDPQQCVQLHRENGKERMPENRGYCGRSGCEFIDNKFWASFF